MVREVAQALRAEQGGWFVDCTLGLGGHMLTRRWAYLVPREGEPVLLVHRIESGSLPRRPGRVVRYAGYHELHDRLREILAGRRSVAMEYCALGAGRCAGYQTAQFVECHLLRQIRSEVAPNHGRSGVLKPWPTKPRRSYLLDSTLNLVAFRPIRLYAFPPRPRQ